MLKYATEFVLMSHLGRIVITNQTGHCEWWSRIIIGSLIPNKKQKQVLEFPKWRRNTKVVTFLFVKKVHKFKEYTPKQFICQINPSYNSQIEVCTTFCTICFSFGLTKYLVRAANFKNNNPHDTFVHNINNNVFWPITMK